MTFFSLALPWLLACAPSWAADAAGVKVIKFATLAPTGSPWMEVMNGLNVELQAKTAGRVKFKMYPDGVQGEDKDVVKKIRIGQLHAAGFTGVGLGEIAPEVRILDAPWLFRNDDEVEFIHQSFAKELNAALEKAGYVLLGWTELGWVHVFSKTPINSPEDMKKAKMWVWEGDPIAQAAYRALGIKPIPLSVVDVMSSLETGMIDAVYGPPLGVTALQWFRRVKHIYAAPMADSSGAVLISKKMFESLSEADRKTLLEVSAKHLRRLNLLSRQENEDALVSLQKQGLKLSARPTPEEARRFEELGRQARQDLAGSLFSAELLERVEQALARRRAESGQPKSGAGRPGGKAQKS
ncbi:MAG TPA: ABC transporter substrate-binding protein [Elusimicrobia bacterium]|nr:ABC transporter substrate-binding protein [Elusimicrobiota bacterium]HBT62469.1 ABC transporter substrate-binding protein [Elusimicrobiota bacterium]